MNQTPTSPDKTAPLRVLMIEDSEDDAILLVRELKRGGFEVYHRRVDTEHELTEALRYGTWDIVFADYTMPKFRGSAAFKMVRGHDHEIPFIFVSGTIGEEMAVEAMKAGANDYVMKGNLRRLIPAVSRELRESLVRKERHRIEAERRAAETALRVSEERHRLLFEHIADMVLVLDRNGTIQFSSPAVKATLGRPPRELIGRPARDFVHPDDITPMLEAFSAATGQPGGVVSQELRMQHRDGSWRTIDAVQRNLLDHEDVGGIVVTLRDVTERKRLEEEFRQAQKLESVGRLAGGIAHDFNNLLTAAMGYAELLLNDSNLREKHQADVKEILRAAERASVLTKGLLAFSRRQVLDLRPIDLNEIVGTVRNILIRLLGEDITLTTNLTQPLAIVRADAGQIEQVIMNLAVNGRDAMAGGGQLTIETAEVEFPSESVTLVEPVDIRGRFVMLAISDTGIGIDAEAQDHLFEPFFTTKPVGKGSGLGLATVYGIVKQSGGHIHVYSEPGHTTFKIFLPVVQEKAVPAASQSDAGPGVNGTETILVVEDEQAVRDFTARGLQTHGYQVLVAEGAREALKILENAEESVDLLLTDVVLRDGNGPMLAADALGRKPRIKVVYMSGYAHEALVQQGMLEPDMTLIDKPFTAAMLTRKIREVLDRP